MRYRKNQRPCHIKIGKDHPYYRMSYKGYISRARLNMAEHLGRCIGSDEYIYYKDGNPFNEDISNLELVHHKELTKLNQINRIDYRVQQLLAEKSILESQLKEIRFNHTPCNCSKCRRSMDVRQREYNL